MNNNRRTNACIYKYNVYVARTLELLLSDLKYMVSGVEYSPSQHPEYQHQLYRDSSGSATI